MAESVEKTLIDKLNEETWTRAAIGNYSAANFNELDAIIAAAKKENILDKIEKICADKLSGSKNSIISLYILSITSLMHQNLDDSNIRGLISIFNENKRLQIVEHLCKQVLQFGESKFALQTLKDLYEKTDEEKYFNVLERLTKIDYNDPESPKKIAERAEALGDKEKAVEYYKKSIYRFIGIKKLSSVKEIWSKLVQLIPDEIEFFYRTQDKVAAVSSDAKKPFLMYDLYQYYAQAENWDVAIDILKLMLHYDSENPKARAEIVQAYSKKYADHSHLQEYIGVSNLNQNWRPVFEAIDEFEKHIAFDTGCFVFHKTWGVGRIASLENEMLKIDFAKRRGHEMSLKMALTSLQMLSPEHIWVLKATKQKDVLSAKVKDDAEWALKTVIKSFGNNCSMKKVKQELVPSLLTPGEWTSWNTKARKILKENSGFGINPDDVDLFTVRERPASIEEKLFNEFKAQKNFFARIEILNTFIEKADVNDEVFYEMFNYFDGFLRAPSQINEQVVASQMLVNSISVKIPHIAPAKQIGFAELYSQIDDTVQIYSDIKDKDLKATFLKNIRMLVTDWADEYIKLFPSVLLQDIIDALIEDGYTAKLQEFVRTCFENPGVFRDAVIWFFKNSGDADWFKEAGVEYEKQLIALINILSLCYREIDNKQNTTENRRTIKQITDLLFEKGKVLEAFVESSDEATVSRLYMLIDDVKGLDSALKSQFKALIQKKFPGFVFVDSGEKEVTALGLVVTAAKLEEKKKELQNIIEVKIPQNQKDLGYALSLGDLRENAEYKAAREEQAKLSNLSSRLQADIERAEVFDPLSVSTKKVGFGTKVSVQNVTDNTTETYTILGPWESDPANGIISYLSPLGHALLNKKKDETFDVRVMEENKKYKVLEISIP